MSLGVICKEGRLILSILLSIWPAAQPVAAAAADRTGSSQQQEHKSRFVVKNGRSCCVPVYLCVFIHGEVAA